MAVSLSRRKRKGSPFKQEKGQFPRVLWLNFEMVSLRVSCKERRCFSDDLFAYLCSQ